MDRIIVMENGVIVEDGNPLELLEQVSDEQTGVGESRYRSLMRAGGEDFLVKMVSEARAARNERIQV